MNIAAMAVITLVVFAEKTLPWDRLAPRTTAAALVAYGAVVIAAPQVLPTFHKDGAAVPAEYADESASAPAMK